MQKKGKGTSRVAEWRKFSALKYLPVRSFEHARILIEMPSPCQKLKNSNPAKRDTVGSSSTQFLGHRTHQSLNIIHDVYVVASGKCMVWELV